MLHPVDVARTHEILARYRPIAPRPPVLDKPATVEPPATPRAPARTPRARKRGRGNCSLSNSQKRYRTTYVPVLPSPLDRGCIPMLPFGLPKQRSCSLDLNLEAPAAPAVIVPQPVRPVGSSISIEGMGEQLELLHGPTVKKVRDVEEEVESDAMPMIVSDSSNRTRLANSAYKEMVGQPECVWLESMVASASGRRIGGEVMLDLRDSDIPALSRGFSCRVRIEWACNGVKRLMRVPCEVERLCCESKDYVFAWKFNTGEASESESN